MTIHTRTLGVVAIGLVVSAPSLLGQDWSRYRNFKLGGTLSSVAKLTGVATTDAKTTTARPALIQELQWRRGYFEGAQSDPVQMIGFSFYDDQLSRIVIDYDRTKTAGMTPADMIDALSVEYGVPVKPALKSPQPSVSQVEQESGDPLARWGDVSTSVVLYRSSYGSGFRIIVTSTKLAALTRTAEAQAVLMDWREAPQREVARQKKEADDSAAAQEKARLANKGTFKP